MLAPWKSYDHPRWCIKSRDITLTTKVHLLKVMVFPIVMYGYESWTIKKAEHQRIDAFFFFLKWASYLIKFFARSSEYYFVRVNSICESKHRAEVALELRDSFDSSQNLWVHSFLINLALLCDLVFLSLCV